MDIGSAYFSPILQGNQADFQRAALPFAGRMAQADLQAKQAGIANQLMMTQYHQAQMQQIQRALQADEALRWFEMDPSKPVSVNLSSAALELQRKGQGTRALQLMEHAALAGQREGQEELRQSMAADRKAHSQIAVSEYLAREAPLAKSQEDWEAILQNAKGMFPGANIPWAGRPFSPELMNMVRASGLGVRDQTIEARKEEEDTARLRRQSASLDLRQREFEFRKLQAADKAERDAAKAKAGEDKGIKQAETAATARWLGSLPEYKGMAPGELMAAGELIADRAKAAKVRRPQASIQALRFEALDDPEVKASLKKAKEGGVFGMGAEKPGFVPSRGSKPSLDQFLSEARKVNPGVKDEDLKAYYKKNYGGE